MRAETVTLRLALSAEQSVIGGVLSEPATFAAVKEILTPEQFEDPSCRMIYQAILDEHEAGEVSLLTVAERLERNGTLPVVGGFPKLVQMAQDVIPGNAVQSARVVRRQAQRAALGRVGARLQEAAEKGSVTPADLAKLAVDYLQPLARETESEARLLMDVTALDARHQAQRWAVKGVVPSNAVGMIFGASGAFKSFVALDYALHRAYGMTWCGRRTAKGTPIYIAAEGGAGLILRIKAWHQLHGMDWRECPMRVVIVPMALMTEAGVLRDAIVTADVTPSDIVVDTMSQCFSGEENSSTEVASFLRTIGTELRDPFGATVIVVHHNGHSATERPRGSSAIVSNTDFVFGCFRDEKEMMATVQCIKQKDGERCADLTFSLHHQVLGKDDDGDDVTSLVAKYISGAAEIIAAATKSGAPSSFTRLLQAIGTGAPEEEVRKRFYESMPESDTDTRRQAYFRAMRRAEGQSLIIRNGDWLDISGGARA